jgi:hypothetical protein
MTSLTALIAARRSSGSDARYASGVDAVLRVIGPLP